MSKSRFKNVINLILNCLIVIFSVLLLLIVILNFQTFFLGKKYNSFFGYSFFEIETGSMSGALEIGDYIIVKKSNDYKLNDIVTFMDNNYFVTHRIVERYNNNFITKGDANNATDEAIYLDNIIGKVVMVFPKFGIIKKVFLNPKIIVFFIVLMILLLNILKDKKKTSEVILKKDKLDDKEFKFASEVFSNIKNEEMASDKTIMLSHVLVDLESNGLEKLKNKIKR